MQLHKLLDINEEKKPNETKYEVKKTLKYIKIQVINKNILNFRF